MMYHNFTSIGVTHECIINKFRGLCYTVVKFIKQLVQIECKNVRNHLHLISHHSFLLIRLLVLLVVLLVT